MSVDLSQLHPVLVAKIGAVLQGMFNQHTPMKITRGFATAGEQALLYDKGRRIPGPDVSPERPLGRTVTNYDGIHKISEHQKGRAVDLCFLGHEPYADSHPWGKFGDLVRAAGLTWGGDFHDEHGKPRPDRPHAELPREIV